SLPESREIHILSKIFRRPFLFPVAGWNGIIVKRNSIHHPSRSFHHGLCPLVMVVRETAGDFIELIAAVVFGEGGEAAIQVGVVTGPHITAAAPAFIADPPE